MCTNTSPLSMPAPPLCAFPTLFGRSGFWKGGFPRGRTLRYRCPESPHCPAASCRGKVTSGRGGPPGPGLSGWGQHPIPSHPIPAAGSAFRLPAHPRNEWDRVANTVGNGGFAILPPRSLRQRTKGWKRVLRPGHPSPRLHPLGASASRHLCHFPGSALTPAAARAIRSWLGRLGSPSAAAARASPGMSMVPAPCLPLPPSRPPTSPPRASFPPAMFSAADSGRSVHFPGTRLKGREKYFPWIT